MALSPELTTGLIAIGSALAGALPGLVSGFVNRKADDKKQLRELVLKTAAENWRFISENQASKFVLPYEHHMIHTAMMCELAFSNEPITAESTAKHLERTDAVMRTLVEHAIAISTRKTST